jgi:hypothetical protein
MNINAIDIIKPSVPKAHINFSRKDRCSSRTEYQSPVNPRSCRTQLQLLNDNEGGDANEYRGYEDKA